MTPIEELVRQALAGTPTATTATDPLAALDRRVRRARRWLAVAAGAVGVAVVVAVAVPLAVLGGNGSPKSVGVAHPTPTSSPSASPLPGVTRWADGAVDVALAEPRFGAPPWTLVRDASGTFIAPVNPNGLTDRVAVPQPADFVAPGQTVQWVAGTDPGSNLVRVSVVDNATRHVDTMTFDGTLSGAPVAVGDALYLVASDTRGASVHRFVLSNDGIDQAASLAVDGATEIVATERGHVWVLAGKKLVEIVEDQQHLSTGSSVDWTGDIYSKTGSPTPDDTIWAYDGDRLIGLTPKYLVDCVSCAEGDRINVAGRPVGVATGEDGSLYVAVSQSSASGKHAGLETGIAYYSADDVASGTAPTATMFGVQVTSLVADPSGGVDYVDDQGALNHWDPPAGAR